jgi:hypothetical protein
MRGEVTGNQTCRRYRGGERGDNPVRAGDADSGAAGAADDGQTGAVPTTTSWDYTASLLCSTSSAPCAMLCTPFWRTCCPMSCV